MQEYKSSLPPSVKAIANMIEDNRYTIREFENRIKNHDSDLEKLEAELERQIYVQERMSKEIHKLKQELEIVKAHSSVAGQVANPAVVDQTIADQYTTGPTVTDSATVITVSSVQAVPEAELHTPQNAIISNVSAKEVLPQNYKTVSTSETVRYASNIKAPVITGNKPIMNGIGFSHITTDYLKSLSKK